MGKVSSPGTSQGAPLSVNTWSEEAGGPFPGSTLRSPAHAGTAGPGGENFLGKSALRCNRSEAVYFCSVNIWCWLRFILGKAGQEEKLLKS